MIEETKNESCGNEFPHFGATYPDACCINGRLWDLDSCETIDGQRGLTIGGNDPCPWCNTEEYIQNFRDNEEPEELIEKHLKFLSERYGNGEIIKYTKPIPQT